MLEMKSSTKILSSLLFFLLLFSSEIFFGELAMAQNTTFAINVGVVLDMDRLVGKVGLSCMSMALSDFYSTHSFYKTRLVLHTRDSKKDVVGAASAALDLLKNVEVQAIIGPVSSSQADFIIDLGNKTQVPIVSFAATSPSLSSVQTPYFVRTAQNDSAQVKAIAAIVQAFGWRQAVPIYEDTEYGNGIIPYLTDALQDIDTRVPYRSVIPVSATDDQIVEELYKLMTMQTRVFIVHMAMSLGSRLFLKAKEVGMMSNGYSWIITDGLSNELSSMDSSVIDSMQGVLGVRPYVPRSKELDNFNVRWKKKFVQENPDVERAALSVFGLWAYDTAWALAMAAEKVGGANFRFLKPNVIDNSSDLATMGVSQIGPELLQAISKTTFKGLSGDFVLVNGQLQSFAFQILNVIGDGGREIGFWTPTSGISRLLNVTSTNLYSASKANLSVIIWPGESIIVPKGWVIPTNGKKLRIGVPVKDGFSEFVTVTWDPTTNLAMATGYCIDVFNAVMDTLPYAVPYDFIPFQKADGSTAGNYNDLIYQVFLQKFDAVVGDTTIRANRSQYVDFTLPYTESGVSMLVPVKDNGKKNAWIFLKPLSRNLWLTIGSFFIFTGFVIWVLEHRINEEFRGPAAYQFGMIFWFSFCTLVFAHREKVVSNLARFVLIIWIFVVLILTSSYTASLTSLLTVQQLQPTITDIKELLKTRESVGYQEGSFVFGLLKQMGFDESKLKTYNSPDEFDQALSKGSQNDGISAAFDEAPYIKLLLARYCAKYTIVGPTYKTDGFGFVFPRGSPLVPDVSRAVLNVTEGDTMDQIVKKWFGHDTSCPDPNNMVSSNSLTLDSFLGLFVIAGVSSILALLVYIIVFYYNHKHIWRHIDPDTSIWQKIRIMARQFDEKDLSSHTFRNTRLQNSSNIEVKGVEASQNINAPMSPSCFSYHTEGPFTPMEDQGTPSVDFGNSNPEILITQEIMPSIELSNVNTERDQLPQG